MAKLFPFWKSRLLIPLPEFEKFFNNIMGSAFCKLISSSFLWVRMSDVLAIAGSLDCEQSLSLPSPLVVTEFFSWHTRNYWNMQSRGKLREAWAQIKGKRKGLRWYSDLFYLLPLTPIWLMVRPSFKTDSILWQSYCCVTDLVQL